jgi:hypothetical protein
VNLTFQDIMLLIIAATLVLIFCFGIGNVS